MDPIGVQGGINLYNYTGNDPVNATDPTGLDYVLVTGDKCVGGYATSDYPAYWSCVPTAEWVYIPGSQIDSRGPPGLLTPVLGNERINFGSFSDFPKLPPRPHYCNSPLYLLGRAINTFGGLSKRTGTGVAVGGLALAGGGAAMGALGGPPGAIAGASPGLAVAGFGADLYAVGANVSVAASLLELAGGSRRSLPSIVSGAFDLYAENASGVHVSNLGKVFTGNAEDAAADAVVGQDPCM